MLIDTHCHLDFDWFDEDRGEVLARASGANVQRIIVPSVDLDNCQKVLDLADKYDAVYAAVGVHPNSSSEWDDQWITELRRLAGNPKVVAIGEIGLDYYRDRSPKSRQHSALKSQLQLASELKLPVILHNREADEDLLSILSSRSPSENDRPGVLHSFSGDWKVAERAIDLGYYLGFTGPITYKKADLLRSVAKEIPLDKVVIETDAPFLSPHPYRGKRNEPAYVVHVAEKLAHLRQLSLEEISQATTQNAARLFGLNL